MNSASKPTLSQNNAASPGLVKSVLTEEMLGRFASRAAAYDRDNRFFTEDFEELRATKYLLLPVPLEFGGAGLKLADVSREQRRLAYHAPATALAVNMHLYWIGVAADLWRSGDKSLDGFSAKPLREKSLPLAMLKVAMTYRCCYQPRKPNAWMAATSYPAASTLAASVQSGPASVCMEWTPVIQRSPR